MLLIVTFHCDGRSLIIVCARQRIVTLSLSYMHVEQEIEPAVCSV